MPNVIAAFQLNEKEKEMEKKIIDLLLPEHKEHHKEKRFT